MEAAEKPVHYVRIPQTYDGKDVEKMPPEFKFTEYPELWWGTAIYALNPDGTLKFLDSDWDSSG